MGVPLIQTDNESHSEEQGTIVLTQRHQTWMTLGLNYWREEVNIPVILHKKTYFAIPGFMMYCV